MHGLYLILAIIFFLSVFWALLFLLGLVLKPTVWKKNISKIKIAYFCWFGLYALFIIFFTGPADLSLYPPRETSPYRLPWKAGESHILSQGNRSFTSHRDLHLYAWDFVMALGTEILAARAGTVLEVKQEFDGIGLDSNYLKIRHSDGQVSMYAHIRKDSALVKEGDKVKQGQPIALCGLVGQTLGPHVHFVVYNEEQTESIPISFREVHGGVPLAGHIYTSENTGD